jgi:hypothetical protein
MNCLNILAALLPWSLAAVASDAVAGCCLKSICTCKSSVHQLSLHHWDLCLHCCHLDWPIR